MKSESGKQLDYLSVNPSVTQDDDRNADVKSPIVSYVSLTITHVIVLHTCRYVFIH